MPSSPPQLLPLAEAPQRVSPLMPSRCAIPRAMTLIEILVVISIVAVVVALVVPAIARARHNSRTTQCLSNLRQIGTAFGIYAEMNNYHLPDPGSTGTQWEDMLAPMATKETFHCAEDAELYDSLGSSYDWRDTSDPATTLAGKQVLGNLRQDAVLAFDALPGWHAPGSMNAVLVDGSAKCERTDQCLGDLVKPVAR